MHINALSNNSKKPSSIDLSEFFGSVEGSSKPAASVGTEGRGEVIFLVERKADLQDLVFHWDR